MAYGVTSIYTWGRPYQDLPELETNRICRQSSPPVMIDGFFYSWPFSISCTPCLGTYAYSYRLFEFGPVSVVVHQSSARTVHLVHHLYQGYHLYRTRARPVLGIGFKVQGRGQDLDNMTVAGPLRIASKPTRTHVVATHFYARLSGPYADTDRHEEIAQGEGAADPLSARRQNCCARHSTARASAIHTALFSSCVQLSVALWQMFPSALAPRIVLCRRVVSLHSRGSSLGIVSRVRLIRCLAARSTGQQDMGYVLPSPAAALAESAASSTTLPIAASSCQQGSSVPLEDLEPQEPGPEDCCQQGCHNCVWNIYRDQHRLWAERNGKVVQPSPAETMLERLEREIEEKARARRAQA